MGRSNGHLRPGTGTNSVHFISMSKGNAVSRSSGMCYKANVPGVRTGVGFSNSCGNFSLSFDLKNTFKRGLCGKGHCFCRSVDTPNGVLDDMTGT